MPVRAWMLVTALVALTLTGAADTDAAPPSAPGPIAGKGYHRVFRDDFNTLNRKTWDSHIWYDSPPSRSWKGFQIVSDGVLHLRTSRSFAVSGGGDWPINTMTTFSSGRTFEYGYFEARMRWTPGQGAWPGFWV